MPIKFELKGFSRFLEDIEKAGGDIDREAEKCLTKSADIVQEEIKAEMRKAKVDADLIEAMPPSLIEKNGGRFHASVGYKKGAYNHENISDGYKIVFLNYGTPNRTKHGQVKARGFILKAKKKANAKIKKLHQQTLDEILRGLNS